MLGPEYHGGVEGTDDDVIHRVLRLELGGGGIHGIDIHVIETAGYILDTLEHRCTTSLHCRFCKGSLKF